MAEKLVYREEGFFGSFDYSVFLQTFTLTKLNTKQRRDKTYPCSFKNNQDQKTVGEVKHLADNYRLNQWTRVRAQPFGFKTLTHC